MTSGSIPTACCAAVARRDMFLGGSAAALLATAAFGADPRRGSGGLIDVHHHIRPPGVPERLAHMMAAWSPEAAIDGMDRCGIAAGMAYPGPVLAGDLSLRPRIARDWNEFGAALAHDHPGRFGLFASLPFPDVAACHAEIDHALDALHADGFGITTSYGDKWLGDAAFLPIWEKLDARRAVVFVHPGDATCCSMPNYGTTGPVIDGSWIEWPMNTARAILSLMTTGTLRRFPRIRFIFAHGGGVMPLLVQRLAGFADWNEVGPQGLATYFPNGIAAEFASLHFECAQGYAHPNIDALRRLVPDGKLLFGTDYPFFPLDHATRDFRALDLPRATRAAIARDNAAKLLPRWA